MEKAVVYEILPDWTSRQAFRQIDMATTSSFLRMTGHGVFFTNVERVARTLNPHVVPVQWQNRATAVPANNIY